MKKSLFLIALSLVFVIATVANGHVGAGLASADQYTISGQVVDSLTNEPIPFATVGVAFEQTPSLYVNAVACDDNGKFEMQLRAPGNYLMTIQSVGINAVVKPFTLTEDNKKVDFGKVFVHEQTQSINEVSVWAQRPLVKVEIDKIVYNVEDDPESKVNNTLEMLRKVPMVTVDAEDKVLLKGASNFKIYLNGKPSNMLSGQNVSDVLKSMPANNIKNIEVITDPGARYDAEGIGGIINIVTIKNLFQGYQGSVSASAGTFGGLGANTFLTAKTGKLGLTGNFNYSNMRRPWSENENESTNFINDQYYKENNNGRYKNQGVFMSGNFEASYEFDTLRLLSFGGNLRNGVSENIMEMALEMFNKSGVLEYSYKTDGENRYEFGSTGANIDYQRSTSKKGENYTLSYRYSNSPNNSGNISHAKDITGTPPIRLDQWYDNKASTTEHTGQLDYINPLNQKHSIEAGVKYILRQNISDVKQYVYDTNGNWMELPINVNSDFEHISNIYSAYGGYSFRTAKIGVRTGVRVEGTQQDVKFRLDDIKNFDVKYNNVVPNVTVSYQIKPMQTIRAGYNLRIFRPSIWYLNPYVNDTDPYNISYGNPDLVPEKSNSINLNYSFFSRKFTLNLSGSYSYVNNSIERYSFIRQETNEVKETTYDNIGRSQRSGLFVNAGWTPIQKLRINFNGGMSYADLKSAELEIANSGLTGNCFVNAILTLPKDFRINANAMYMSGAVMLQGKQSGYYFSSFSANKDFLQKKLTVSLMFSNPFSQNLKINVSTTTDYFETNYKMFYPMREGRISISYRFGNMKEGVKKVQRSISNDDVKSGGGGGSGIDVGM